MHKYLHTLTNQEVLVSKATRLPNTYTVFHLDEFGDICGKELIDQFELDSDFTKLTN